MDRSCKIHLLFVHAALLLLLLLQLGSSSNPGSSSSEVSPYEKLAIRKYFASLGVRGTYNAYLSCSNCFFPLWPQQEQITDKLRRMPLPDLTNKWIYFFGDSTLRQMYKSTVNILRKTDMYVCQQKQPLLWCLYRSVLFYFQLFTLPLGGVAVGGLGF